MFPVVVSADHSAARDVDCHSAALLVQVALRVLNMIPLIGWSLKHLLEALLRIGVWTGITSRGLSLKPPLLGLHLLALVVDNNSVIH